MRLIDADALEEEIRTKDIMGGLNYRSFIKNAPTIEMRQSGTWKCYIHSAYHGVDEYDEPIWRDVKVYHCRFCNRRTVIKENFCPNCGADMREGSE